VVTHTDAVSVPGWTGAGYIITDPVKGDGAYRIAGGGNGGAFDDLILGISFFITTISGAIDGFVSSAAENLPLPEDLNKALLAKKLEPLGKYLGGLSLLSDIITTLFDKNLDISSKVGRISVALFGFGIGSLAGVAIGAAFAPVAAAIIASVFAITLTLVLLDFNEIYFSLLIERMRHKLIMLQA
jgi:hypothetical protein